MQGRATTLDHAKMSVLLDDQFHFQLWPVWEKQEKRASEVHRVLGNLVPFKCVICNNRFIAFHPDADRFVHGSNFLCHDIDVPR